MTSPASEFSTEYRRQISHESGIDNPFRPDGELSREAEAIVSLIKEGKPITPCELDMDMANGGFPQSQHDATDSTTNGKVVKEVAATLTQSKPKPTNGSTVTQPGVVEVQRGVIVPPMDAPAVEQVVIKKKPKCNCCVIQ